MINFLKQLERRRPENGLLLGIGVEHGFNFFSKSIFSLKFAGLFGPMLDFFVGRSDLSFRLFQEFPATGGDAFEFIVNAPVHAFRGFALFSFGGRLCLG